MVRAYVLEYIRNAEVVLKGIFGIALPPDQLIAANMCEIAE